MVKVDGIEPSPSTPKVETQPLRYTELAGQEGIEPSPEQFWRLLRYRYATDP